ncbi:OPI10-like protein [Chlorella sorokiniana]|uniref:OPI10-like protein n=1 Tax=Chlorella sorokiniana TaxID=3076 RepID=A0A2P6U4H7_CHLSO|nr:OPI10-like protein [Chlorella sorokiniana]|eukprot:PRW61209.1 OPI10-like protein [Chlorella sorokiniana]
MGLGARATAALYVSIGGADWSYRGYVSNSHPSDVLPLSWPEPDANTQQQLAGLAALPPGFAQVGVSVEPLAELAQKEGSKLGAKEDFVKAVAYNLFAYMQSFGAVQALGGDKLLDQWFQKTMDRLRRDPDFLTRRKDVI